MPRREDYYDFHVALEADGKGGVEVKILRSLAGRATAAFEKREAGVPPAGKSFRQCAELEGQALFESLFDGEIGEKYRISLMRLKESQRAAKDRRRRCMRVRLAIDPDCKDLAEAIAYEWEQMFDAESDRFLTRSRQTTLVRDLELPPVLPDLPGEHPVRILIVGAQPDNLLKLNVEGEVELIEKAWRSRDDVEVERLQGGRLRDLEERLEADEPVHILHFIGHGQVDEGEVEGMLYFERTDGTDHPVSGKQLAERLEGETSLRLIVLAACETSLGPCTAPARSIAASLMKTGFPAVVAMRRKADDSSAVAFSYGFHRALASGMEVDAAVTKARLEVDDTDELFEEWSTPTLFMSSLDGRIFHFGGNEPKRLGIKSRVHPYGPLEEESEHVCDLAPFFAGRRAIRGSEAWTDEVLPHLDSFLRQHVETKRRLILRLDAHLTIAFATGWLIDTRGIDVTLRQALMGGGIRDWRYDFEKPWRGSLWREEHRGRPGSRGREVAVAIGVTDANLAPVESYVDRHLSDRVSRILAVTPFPNVGNDAIRSANHAFALAQELKRLIKLRTEEEQDGPLHLFFAAPWSLAFFLGQLSRGFGEIQLYEWGFEDTGPKDYSPSLLLATEEGGRR